jgi:hypothetical protein
MEQHQSVYRAATVSIMHQEQSVLTHRDFTHVQEINWVISYQTFGITPGCEPQVRHGTKILAFCWQWWKRKG